MAAITRRPDLLTESLVRSTSLTRVRRMLVPVAEEAAPVFDAWWACWARAQLIGTAVAASDDFRSVTSGAPFAFLCLEQ